jgi:preprotein translocase subunit SecG
MIYLLTTIHVLVCLFLVVVVLLQSGKAADLAGAFGGMGSQTAFGPRGTATLLSKWTTIAAAMFMVTSLSLALLQTRSSGASSVVDRVKPTAPAKTTTTTPVPAATPGQGGSTVLPGPGNPKAAPGSLPVVTPAPGSGGTGANIQFPANAGRPAAPAQPQPQPAQPQKK